MKKLSILALGLGLLAITACNNKKAETAAPAAQPVEEVITDSAYQQKAAGDYKSPDQKTVITLNADMTASVQNYSKEYYKWEFVTKPEGDEVNIVLVRKGIDADIKDQAILDTAEGKIVVDNETLRKPAK